MDTPIDLNGNEQENSTDTVGNNGSQFELKAPEDEIDGIDERQLDEEDKDLLRWMDAHALYTMRAIWDDDYDYDISNVSSGKGSAQPDVNTNAAFGAYGWIREDIFTSQVREILPESTNDDYAVIKIDAIYLKTDINQAVLARIIQDAYDALKLMQQ